VHVVTNFVAQTLMEKWISAIIKIEKLTFILCGWWWAHNTAKTCDTAVMGHGVTLGLKFWNHTHTHGTHGCDTAELPVPMLHPSCLLLLLSSRLKGSSIWGFPLACRQLQMLPTTLSFFLREFMVINTPRFKLIWIIHTRSCHGLPMDFGVR